MELNSFLQVKQKYLEVAKRMKEYEDLKYDHWRDWTEQMLPVLLKKTLLAKVHPSGTIVQANLEPSDQVRGGRVRCQSSAYSLICSQVTDQVRFSQSGFLKRGTELFVGKVDTSEFGIIWGSDMGCHICHNC